MLFEISSPASGRLLDLVDQWSKRYPEDLPLRRALRGLLADLHADPALIELDSEALEAIRSRAADLLAAFPDDRELVLIDAALTAAV
ncbi:hypothetical protein [Miltoncostaea oceani]|uniref:hypothetical protein n=1 Tax=Miltoncostaea oceani TaxID=2843216 RepID=UPI001C3C988C|nr:hypothetical protein [Miltoncostaea oceani]